MTRFRPNHPLLFTVIMAFLAIQWTTTHIHLAKFHEHDAEYHQHPIEVHAHQSIDQEASATDVAHQNDYSNVVDFGQEYRSSNNEKQKHPSSVVVSTAIQPLHSSQVTTENWSVINFRLRDLNRSTIIPRAPPYAS